MKFLYELLLPAILLIATYFAIPQVSQLSPSLQDLVYFAPYGLVILGMAIGAKFNRSRVFFFLLVIGIAVYAYDMLFVAGDKGHAATVMRNGFYYLLPLNTLLFFLFRERGIFGVHGLVRAIFLIAQMGVLLWLVESNQAGLIEYLNQQWVNHKILAAIALPQPLLTLMVIVLLCMLSVLLLFNRSPIDSGFLAAFVGIGVGLLYLDDPVAFRLFLDAVMVILIIAVIQDSHRMAYRDELTGLLARRALNEYMMGLGRRYTIAMLDVDHFKKFNDTYGHDVGDQVLKMVGAQMSEITGGGKPFRYGGEEFAIIFPRKAIEKTIPHLEALRCSIEAYKMQIRSQGRPKKNSEGKKQRSAKKGGKAVSVTISIGVAERNGEAKNPEMVIKQADKALYRAKKKGRNCLSK